MDLVRQIDHLRAEVDAITGIAPLHIQFVPIRLITILEVFLREVIAELVDAEEISFERVDKLVKGAKINLAFGGGKRAFAAEVLGTDYNTDSGHSAQKRVVRRHSCAMP